MPRKISVREFGGKKTGKRGNVGMWENGAKKSPLNDGVCVSFFKKTVHQVSVRLGIAIFLFREQAAKLCFSAIWVLCPVSGLSALHQ